MNDQKKTAADRRERLWAEERARQFALLSPRQQWIAFEDPMDGINDALDERTEKAIAERLASEGKDWGEQ
jgi:hypothetical protein